MEDELITNINALLARINNACVASGRPRESVKLLLATKTVPAERIKQAVLAGHTLIGENKVQEIREKFDDLGGVPHQMHFIGHLQTNRIKDVLRYNRC